MTKKMHMRIRTFVWVSAGLLLLASCTDRKESAKAGHRLSSFGSIIEESIYKIRYRNSIHVRIAQKQKLKNEL